MSKRPEILESNLNKAAKILRVTPGALLKALGGQYRIRLHKQKFTPIRWDGTERSASKVCCHMPSRTIATCGGAPGFPVQLFLQTKRGRQIGEAKKGDWIGIDHKGNACVVPAPRDLD